MFFFFKQKTAYEMRISDWSSDVCSSDLRRAEDQGAGNHPRGEIAPLDFGAFEIGDVGQKRGREQRDGERKEQRVKRMDGLPARGGMGCQAHSPLVRSEEHTSELQSLMRNSYDVFCLKKKSTIKKVISHII